MPCRGGFEGGQTSGLKAGKKQPIVPKPAASGSRTLPGRVWGRPKSAKRPEWKPLKRSPLCQSLPETVKSQVLKPLAEPVATVPRREAFEGGQTSGLKAGKKQPIVPKPAASGSRTLPGRVWGRPNVRSDRRWNTAHCARACRKRWKAKFWSP